MKNIRTYSKGETKIGTNLKTETKTKAMKKMSLVSAILCAFTLLTFNACSSGYGCYYSASENISEQPETLTIAATGTPETLLSEEINCIP